MIKRSAALGAAVFFVRTLGCRRTDPKVPERYTLQTQFYLAGFPRLPELAGDSDA
jgi:hypothetical protein